MRRIKKPLIQSDPDSMWEPEAKRLGLTVPALREQVRLADSILEEIINQENFQRKSKRWFSHP